MPERPLVVEESPAPEDLKALRQGLIDYNLARIDRPLATDVAAFVRVDMGRVVAGVNGEIRWGWLFVDRLWVDDGLRGQGLGSKLLLLAEEACQARGVTRIMTDTSDFQAPAFYQKHGFETFATLDNRPPGHRSYFMRKIGL